MVLKKLRDVHKSLSVGAIIQCSILYLCRPSKAIILIVKNDPVDLNQRLILSMSFIRLKWNTNVCEQERTAELSG